MSDNEIGQKEIGEFIAMWAPSVKGLEDFSQGKPFWWTVTTLAHAVVTKGGADTHDLARQAALEAIEDRQGQETEALIRRDLERHMKEHGHYHPSVAYDLNRLFLWLTKPERLDEGPPRLGEAEEVIRMALAVTERASGREDPNYARGLSNLGFILELTDRKAKAKEAYAEAVRILESALGSDHPDTRRVQEDLDGLARP